MFKNYVTVAWRNVRRHWGFALINVTGLAVGMACCLLITIYVRDELSYDRYHENAERIYRVIHVSRYGENPQTLPPPAPKDFQVWGNAPVGSALKADFPEVLEVVQFTGRKSLLLQHGERRFQEEDTFYADSTVFEVFSWPLLAGDPDRALTAPYSIVLTQSAAQKYFGDENAVGQTLIIDNEESFTVTGVMEDVPANSHFTFDVLLSMSTFRQGTPGIFDAWGYVDFYTYFLVPEQFDVASLKAKAPDFVKRRVPPDEAGNYALSFEPLTGAYLHSQAARQPGTTGSLTNLYVFSAVAVFILLIACINFMNLSTARSMERAKEVGVRKAVGARRTGLINQFLTESVLLSLIAAVLALGLAALCLPAFRMLSGKAFPEGALLSPDVVLILFAAAVGVGLLAGVYPAFVLARFRPALVLKGVFRSSSKGVALRKGLVVFQFSLSVALIAGTAVVFSQLEFLRSRDLGFQHEHMLVIDFGYDEIVRQQIEAIKRAFVDHPAVTSASASRTVPGGHFPGAGTRVASPEGQMPLETPNLYEVDFDFIPHFEIEMAAGRPYSRDFSADSEASLLLNEAAAKLYGYARPEDVVGERFSQWGREGTIIGVVKDFNYLSLHGGIEPLTLRLSPWVKYLSLRLKTDDLATTIAELEDLWGELAPQRPFLYSFLDESFNRQYLADLRFGRVVSVFAGLAILIACLGLFGLASFATAQRTKEIGVRKVLGASVGSIVALLSKDFLKLVGIAFVLAAPVAYYAMSRWLEGFAYRTSIGVGVFLLAGGLALAIALLTVSYRSIKAALADPVKSLRYE
jgi:putative ABC transport system permease protein